MNKEKVPYYAFIVFFLLMLFDAHLTAWLVGLSQGAYIWHTHLLLLALMCGIMSTSQQYMFVSALAIGVFYDFYYLGVLGVYAVIFPFIVWLMIRMKDFLFQNVFTLFFSTIIFVTVFEMMSLGIQLLFKLTTISNLLFVTHYLAPTLLINIVLFIVCIYPFKKLFPTK